MKVAELLQLFLVRTCFRFLVFGAYERFIRKKFGDTCWSVVIVRSNFALLVYFGNAKQNTSNPSFYPLVDLQRFPILPWMFYCAHAWPFKT